MSAGSSGAPCIGQCEPGYAVVTSSSKPSEAYFSSILCVHSRQLARLLHGAPRTPASNYQQAKSGHYLFW